jgi:class 3 adenylate cyclase
LDADESLLINFVGPRGTIPAVPFHDVLAAARNRQARERNWEGTIVLIGVTTLVSEDLHPVPRLHGSLSRALRAAWLYHDADIMPGVEVHANLIATVADRAFITTPWWLSGPLMLAFCGAVLGPLLARCSLELGAALTLAHHLGWQLVCLLFFRWHDWRVDMVSVLILGPFVYATVFALRWRWMRRMMGLFKSEAVARTLEADPSQLDLRGEQRLITVLFIDVRDFTGFAETRPAADVVRLLNAFFAAAVPVIEAEKGIVNQYLGDGLMAIFGAPEPLTDHALRAVRAAEAIVQRVHELAPRWQELGAESFRIGAGVHTGPAVVGAVGSPRRLDYTAIGDTVNTAARIEACNKSLLTELLVSEATLRALPLAEQNRRSTSLRSNTVEVKGKREPLNVYTWTEPK